MANIIIKRFIITLISLVAAINMATTTGVAIGADQAINMATTAVVAVDADQAINTATHTVSNLDQTTTNGGFT